MKYSIVIPLYNEEENLTSLYDRLTKVMHNRQGNYEFIIINDGSNDRSPFILSQLADKDPHIKVLHFSRNFGHQMAVSAGLTYSSGEYVAVIDADLQDPPEILPYFFKKLDEGYDTVYAVRKNRKENPLLRFAYSVYYRLLRLVSETDIPVDSGDFAVMRRHVVEAINRLPERNRYVRGLRTWVGFRQIGMIYERDARFKGKSKYSLKKLFKLAFDGIFSFSYVPFRFMFYMGIIALLSSFSGTLFVLYQKFFTTNYSGVPGFATTIILIVFIGGLQLFSMGMTGEYIKRIYDEIKGRPQYIIASKEGFDS